MITSQNRPGLPDCSRVTLKNMGRPGDEASTSGITCGQKSRGGGGEKQLIDLEWPNLPAGSDRVRLLYCRHNWV